MGFSLADLLANLDLEPPSFVALGENVGVRILVNSTGFGGGKQSVFLFARVVEPQQ